MFGSLHSPLKKYGDWEDIRRSGEALAGGCGAEGLIQAGNDDLGLIFGEGENNRDHRSS
jgi:hypothetical protein